MLNIAITPHREFLPADSDEQKLFLMLKLRPTKQVANTRPPTNIAFVIDTSGSMYSVVAGEPQPTDQVVQMDGQQWRVATGGKTKIDIVIESLRSLLHSGKLDANDRISIIQFDDQATTLISATPATEVAAIDAAILRLKSFSGGTRMGLGLKQALHALDDHSMASRRALVFTDGQTVDEDLCDELAKQFSIANIPMIALGVGEFNEDLLNRLSDVTGGKPFHVVPGTATGTAVSILDFPNTIVSEIGLVQQEVITNLALTVKTVKGVALTRVLRAYPSQAEFSLDQDPHSIGNVLAHDETVFILEFTIASRTASRIRIAQLGLTYDVPGENRRGELDLQNVVVQFVAGQELAVQVDQEVMGYVQQCNIAQVITEATRIAEQDPHRAEELLESARRMTKRLGNTEMTDSLTSAQDELRKTRRISSATRKTIKMGSKSKTVKMGQDINDELSEAEIRQASGT
ncbi:von Willebrand factor type A [Leptolyngbya boryana NIES-2135]|jgi:Ca-activated chloride channel family protein|uniref:von Willebrand factor type A n=1 Tax=Leptolyngbya boryana NIES-2135 TaxID=1973484 RepID=A0A1Z4JBL7_LEPBY|nr:MULTISPECIES: VWA domain-containing protein [Leptolyngbya]BAY54159.1 von Willebrand factor type A [Leptolyngbya boryana NIES-2135]MBD2371008.1 VWA domain-containing protein [Leptolyngbya sp. FACHB-161]MBD2377534.1 VWA domain-containing protein [Leptolyngbya sp. FACHB-238]MBD2401942.1 VWA domain-containing protein [Leptolyngbya sp. FACHB-239]MBD2408460.1 VWA domain-containing protein [Leptolyngbya sp. FACHB-402]